MILRLITFIVVIARYERIFLTSSEHRYSTVLSNVYFQVTQKMLKKYWSLKMAGIIVNKTSELLSVYLLLPVTNRN